MVNGAHVILYSKDAEADREVLREVFQLPHVDAGGGWLIFGLPPAEVAIHPGTQNDRHELYFLCDDVQAFIAEVSARGLATDPIEELGWGRLTRVTLPSGGKVGVYEPRHPRAPAAGGARPATGAPKRPAVTRAKGKLAAAKGKAAKPKPKAARPGKSKR